MCCYNSRDSKTFKTCDDMDPPLDVTEVNHFQILDIIMESCSFLVHLEGHIYEGGIHNAS